MRIPCRCGQQLDRAGLGVPASDVLAAEIHKVKIVPGVCGDAINGVPAGIHAAAARSERLIRPEGFKPAACKVQPVNSPNANVIQPNLSVDAEACRHDHRLLSHVAIDVGWEGEGLELLSARIKLYDGALEHHALPDVSVFVYFNIQAALRESVLEFGDGVLGHLARPGVELAQILRAEVA